MTPLVEVVGVSKAYGSVRALDGVDLRVDVGERLAIIGPNGSGKTTLFNVISGFVPPSGGRVWFRGDDITRASFEATARRGLVRTFQHDAVFPGLSVADNVRLPLRRRRVRDDVDLPADVEAVLHLADLWSVRDKLAERLSYGHRRRLGVAVAASTNPSVVMLDEPAAGLNEVETAELARMLEKLHGFGLTIMVIEHDMTFVSALCTRAVVLNVGKVIATGTPAEVRRDEAVAEAYLGEAIARAV